MIKNFKNINEALALHAKCYICGNNLKAYLEGIPIDGNIQIELTYGMNCDVREYLHIDKDTNDFYVQYIEMRELSTPLIDSSSLSQKYSSLKPNHPYRKYHKYNETMYFYLKNECSSCFCFAHIILLTVDFKSQSIKVSPNHEGIVLKNNNTKHSFYICNDFENGITQLSEVNCEPISIPLIDIDFINVNNTISRIKKLAAFK